VARAAGHRSRTNLCAICQGESAAVVGLCHYRSPDGARLGSSDPVGSCRPRVGKNRNRFFPRFLPPLPAHDKIGIPCAAFGTAQEPGPVRNRHPGAVLRLLKRPIGLSPVIGVLVGGSMGRAAGRRNVGLPGGGSD
jgi:hypothetical protein